MPHEANLYEADSQFPLKLKKSVVVSSEHTQWTCSLHYFYDAIFCQQVLVRKDFVSKYVYMTIHEHEA